MSDPLRTDTTGPRDAPSGSDRIATIERLLVAGLDRYFAAEYQQAINIWTRALFLDRAHPRARAYIERARSALAEQHRESEELLQRGIAAFQQGDSGQARRLLQDALDRGAHRDEALAALHRLERVERAHVDTERPAEHVTRTRGSGRVADWVRSTRVSAPILLASAVVAGVTMWGGRHWWPADGTEVSRDAPVAPIAPVATGSSISLPLPTRAERALERGQALATSGRLHDALLWLEQVRATDAQRAQADRLRAHIQRQLIALALGNPVEPIPPDGLRP
jgi:hypothetical protein